MGTYVLEKKFETQVEMSRNVGEVASMFGLGGRRDRVYRILDHCEIEIGAGQVVYITGGSGAGKSVVLRMLKEEIKNQESGDRSQESKDRNQESGDRSQESKDRKQESGDRSQESKDKNQESGDRSQESKDRKQESGDRSQESKDRRPVESGSLTVNRGKKTRSRGQKNNTVIDLDEWEVPSGKPIVDCFGEAELEEALGWLSMAGLSDAFAMLRKPEELSDGQRYRFRLAQALAQRPKYIFIDEFCASLDRVTAAVVAANVRKFAERFGTTFVVATSHDDLLEDLGPDVVVVKHLGCGCEVYYPRGGVRC